MNSVVRVGLIGCGMVAERRHLPALQALRDVEVVAAADPDEVRLVAVADRFGIERRYADHQALLADSDVGAVAVLTPTQSHVRIATDALDAGKHVLIEKPLGLSIDECDQLIAKASESPSKVMVGLNMRWYSLVNEAREIVRQGGLGQLAAVRSVFSQWRLQEAEPEWKKRRELGGGVVINEGVHHFDLWSYLTGRKVEQVCAVGQGTAEHEDVTVVVAAKMTGGLPVCGVISLKSGGQNEVELYGTRARLRLSLYRFDGLEFSPTTAYPGDVSSRLRTMISAIGRVPHALRARRLGGSFVATFQAQWRHFLECIQEDRQPACTLEDGRRVLRVAIAASHAISSGQVVDISKGPRWIAPPSLDEARRTLTEAA